MMRISRLISSAAYILTCAAAFTSTRIPVIQRVKTTTTTKTTRKGGNNRNHNVCNMPSISICYDRNRRFHARLWNMNLGLSSKGDDDGQQQQQEDHDDDENEEDDEYLDDVNLEDWRNFRKRLVETTGTSATVSGTGSYSENDDGVSTTSTSSASTGDSSSGSDDNNSSNISKANEELLKSQSKTLHAEGIWAHESSMAEVGGLLLRMPLEVELYKNKDSLTFGKELTMKLEVDGMESNSKPLLSSSSSSSSSNTNSFLNKKNPDLSFSLTAAQTLLWYTKTQSFIDDEMLEITNLADENGQINSRQLKSKSEEILKLYLDNRQSWQEVCLVVERNDKNGHAVTYVLNRPMAFRLNENLARLVLFGAFDAMNIDKVSVSQMNLLTKFLRAFESSCGVYIGGPDEMDQKAVLLHGIADLDGAEEIAPGTGIFRGGLNAAIEGVLEGKYNSLDFRFMVGCHRYKGGQLEREIYDCKHQSVACARALALKQCIQLPKPLWHEVMELCGGELREISRLELLKRDDIQD